MQARSGSVIRDFGGVEGALKVVAQNDGKLVVMGFTFNSSSQGFALARYNADGSADSSFGSAGKVNLTTGGMGLGGLVFSDGKILVVGPFQVGRFTAEGVLDPSFGTSGLATRPTPAQSFVVNATGQVVEQAGGKLVIAESGFGGGTDVRLYRLNADGSKDATFGRNGEIFIDFGADDQAAGLALQPDGSLLVAGGSTYRAVRVTKDGALDTAFGTGGRILNEASGERSGPLLVQDDGKFLVASLSGGLTNIYRHYADGSLDATFDGDGRASAALSAHSLGQLARQSDGKYLVCGTSDGKFLLARLDASGKLDQTFGTGGKVTADLSPLADTAFSISLLANGRIAVSGQSGEDFVLAVFESDGQLSRQFGAPIFAASVGADTFHSTPENDQIDGQSGVDTVVYSGAAASYTVSRVGTSIRVQDGALTRDGSDLLTNIERIRFSDKSVAFDIEGNGGAAFRLYQAAFSRRPDESGLGFQIAQLDRGLTLSDIAKQFLASPEFSSTYGSLDDSAFVSQLYRNVLYREADAGGLAFHVDRLQAGTNRSDVLVGFSESPENKAALVGVTTNGIFYT